MKNRIAVKVMSLVVAVTFFVSDISYALSPGVLSGDLGNDGRGYVVSYMITHASQHLAAVRGPGSEVARTLTAFYCPENFVTSGNEAGSDLINFERQDASARQSFIEELSAILTAKGSIYADASIEEGYFKAKADDGDFPIALEISDNSGKTTLLINTAFIQSWNHIRENNLLLTCPAGRGVEHWDSTDLAKELCKKVASILEIELDRDSKITDAVWLWFLGSYCVSPMTRYNNNIFMDRLEWQGSLFEGGAQSIWDTCNCHDWPDVCDGAPVDPVFNDEDYQERIAYALRINQEFFSRPSVVVPEITVRPELVAAYEERLAAARPTSVVRTPQPRDARGRFMERPGKSPDDAMAILALSELGTEGSFTVRDYIEAYTMVAAAHPELSFEKSISESTARRDLYIDDDSLVNQEYISIVNLIDVARDKAGAYEFSLTENGKATIAAEKAWFDAAIKSRNDLSAQPIELSIDSFTIESITAAINEMLAQVPVNVWVHDDMKPVATTALFDADDLTRTKEIEKTALRAERNYLTGREMEFIDEVMEFGKASRTVRDGHKSITLEMETVPGANTVVIRVTRVSYSYAWEADEEGDHDEGVTTYDIRFTGQRSAIVTVKSAIAPLVPLEAQGAPMTRSIDTLNPESLGTALGEMLSAIPVTVHEYGERPTVTNLLFMPGEVQTTGSTDLAGYTRKLVAELTQNGTGSCVIEQRSGERYRIAHTDKMITLRAAIKTGSNIISITIENVSYRETIKGGGNLEETLEAPVSFTAPRSITVTVSKGIQEPAVSKVKAVPTPAVAQAVAGKPHGEAAPAVSMETSINTLSPETLAMAIAEILSRIPVTVTDHNRRTSQTTLLFDFSSPRGRDTNIVNFVKKYVTDLVDDLIKKGEGSCYISGYDGSYPSKGVRLRATVLPDRGAISITNVEASYVDVIRAMSGDEDDDLVCNADLSYSVPHSIMIKVSQGVPTPQGIPEVAITTAPTDAAPVVKEASADVSAEGSIEARLKELQRELFAYRNSMEEQGKIAQTYGELAATLPADVEKTVSLEILRRAFIEGGEQGDQDGHVNESAVIAYGRVASTLSGDAAKIAALPILERIFTEQYHGSDEYLLREPALRAYAAIVASLSDDSEKAARLAELKNLLTGNKTGDEFVKAAIESLEEIEMSLGVRSASSALVFFITGAAAGIAATAVSGYLVATGAYALYKTMCRRSEFNTLTLGKGFVKGMGIFFKEWIAAANAPFHYIYSKLSSILEVIKAPGLLRRGLAAGLVTIVGAFLPACPETVLPPVKPVPVEPAPAQSPDHQHQAVVASGYLIVSDEAGFEIGRIQVSAEQVSLTSFSVTNEGIYMASNQRGNAAIQYASFDDLDTVMDVQLPGGMTPWSPESIEFVPGTSYAWITGTDRISHFVDLAEGVEFAVSPDQEHAAVQQDGYLVVLDRAGIEIGRIQVSAQEAYLVSFNVTDGGIYMVFSQRGNTSIEYAPYDNLDEVVTVGLPEDITPWNPQSVEFVAGLPQAWITGTDRVQYLVDLETGTVLATETAGEPSVPAEPALPAETAEEVSQGAALPGTPGGEGEHPLIKVIREYAAAVYAGEGPGSMALSKEDRQAAWESINLLHDSKIEILLEQSMRLPDPLKRAIEDIQRREGEDALKCTPFSTTNLGQVLNRPVPAGVKRIIVTDKRSAAEVGTIIAAADPKALHALRALPAIELPANYARMDTKEKTVYMADIVMIAILARLYERDGKTPFVEAALRTMVEKRLYNGDESEETADTFMKGLAESDDEKADPSRIAKRIIDCLGKLIKFSERIARELPLLRELWTAA